MARILLITEDEVKEFTNITANVDVSKFCPYIPIAQDKKIKNAIGESCYNDLLDGVENDNLTPEEDTLLDGNGRQFLGVRQALAWWTLYYAYHNLYANITATGIHTKDGEQDTSVDENIYSIFKRDALVQAEYYLDQLICYICDNSADYPCFRNSDSCCEENIKDGYGSSGIVLDDFRRDRDRCHRCNLPLSSCCCNNFC